ncbi:hypothetical protein like AT5G64880 [Hibiscus trionum]|uniref:Uncharacterized protein n=1 Tax=Hibiscus trionum TaxID=183268 RepID=A0A9W7IFH6_HIBTR|nr:hypothetical protein like AT5G64880 [Hibiscus trionum]
MFDFGDELTIQNFRIPWLIWIQILVMFLLILLLYCFTTTTRLSTLDLSDGFSAASASLYPESRVDKMPVFNHTSTLVSTRFQTSQVGEEQSIKGEISPGTSRGIIRAAEDGVEMGECSGNQNCYHPCHYLKLAKLAFLKCLGLDSLSESSSKTSEQRKQR